jgi:hypothetical protein
MGFLQPNDRDALGDGPFKKGNYMLGWQTKISGTLSGLVILFQQIETLLDTDPATNPAYSMCAAAIAAIWFTWTVRPNGVTSEQAGAK